MMDWLLAVLVCTVSMGVKTTITCLTLILKEMSEPVDYEASSECLSNYPKQNAYDICEFRFD